MKKQLVAAVLAVMVMGAGVSSQAATLWTGLSDSAKATGIYWPLGNSGMSLGTFAGFSFPTVGDTDSEEFGINSGFLSIDGIPVAGGVELGVEFSKPETKDTGYNYAIVLGKSYLFDLTDDVQIGFYVDVLRYATNTKANSDSKFTLLGNMYPVIAAEVKLW